MNSPILSLLKTREAFELHILSKYQDILDRIFQVIYELKVPVLWERIYRFSSESNFVMVVGLATLEKGTSLGEIGKIEEEELKISISFTIPLEAFDNGSTPYQIVDMIKDLSAARQVIGSEAFIIGLKEKDTTMKTMQKYVPVDVTDEAVKKEIKDGKAELKKYPHLNSSFDIDKLSDKQKIALDFTMMRNQIK